MEVVALDIAGRGIDNIEHDVRLAIDLDAGLPLCPSDTLNHSAPLRDPVALGIEELDGRPGLDIADTTHGSLRSIGIEYLSPYHDGKAIGLGK